AYLRNSWRGSLAPMVAFTASTDGKGWRRALRALQEELLRAKAYGLTQAELDEAKGDCRKMLERAVKQASKLTNEDYAASFVAAANADRVFTSPEEDLRIFGAVEKDVTLEAANAALKAALAPENRRVSVSGDADVDEAAVRSCWEGIAALSIEPPADEAARPFPYLKLPEYAAQPAALQPMPLEGAPEGVSASRAALANGVEVVLLKLPFEKGTARASLTFGDGLAGLPDGKAAVARLAAATLSENGVGAMTALQTQKAFGGIGLSVYETAGERRNSIAGESQAGDAPLLLQAMWTQFSDPVITEKNREARLRQIDMGAYRRNKTVEGAAARWAAYFTGMRKRNLPLERAEAEKVSAEAMRAYLADARMRGPRRLLVSGDFDEAAVLKEAQRLFGALPAASLPARSAGLAPAFPPAGDKTVEVEGDGQGKAVVSLAFEASLPDVTDRKAALARSVLAAIVRDRMRVRLREEMGIAYSPTARLALLDEDAGFGYLALVCATKAPAAGQAQAAMREIVQSLVKDGVTAEEFERQVKPRKTSWRSARKRNALWQGLVSRQINTGLPYVRWNKEMGENLEALSPGDVAREIPKVFAGPGAGVTVRSK
ncbi:MAG: insulinase family protein, partial [Duodenibacillus sp.]|nr:insulinase family protein [Duodenibacillus sp.]